MTNHTHTHTHTSGNFVLDAPIFVKLYDFYLQVTQVIVRFPKTKRYTLGQRIDETTLEMFGILFSLPLASEKVIPLGQVSCRLDLLKVLLRLAKDTQSLPINQYLALEAQLQEIGKMLGGWIRHLRTT